MDFIGSMFGYLLWGLYYLCRNYGVAIILFTVIVKLITFPLNINQQKSMASQSRMAAKQKEIQERYPTDKQKQSEEMQKLYDQEGASPMAGCLPMLLPLIIMFGIIGSVTNPLTSTLHIEKGSVESGRGIAAATDYISRIPGMTARQSYPEHQVIRHFDVLEDKLAPFFTQEEVDRIQLFSEGFDLFGMDLFLAPRDAGWRSPMMIIPILSFIVNMLTQFYSERSNPNRNMQQQGCMRVTMYLLPLLSVYYAYSMSGAMGIYWVASGLTGFLQIVVTNQFFSVHHMTAKAEAAREATMLQNEQKLKPLPASVQVENARVLERQPQVGTQKDKAHKKNQTAKKKGRSQQNNSSQYKGNRK